MEPQEVGNKRIRNEIELIGERAARIGTEAGALFRLAERAEQAGALYCGEEDEVLLDRLRNVAGTLEVVITYLEVAGERVEAGMPYEPAPGVTPPPWA
jgi:hypothetical protein